MSSGSITIDRGDHTTTVWTDRRGWQLYSVTIATDRAARIAGVLVLSRVDFESGVETAGDQTTITIAGTHARWMDQIIKETA